MNNDLISREALKQAFTEECCGCCDNCSHCLTGYKCELIDNAPTVCGNNPKWCESCVSKGKCASTRPQGEWIKWNFKTFGALGDWEYKCSNCEKVYGGEYNFCPNCGVRMKGGTE